MISGVIIMITKTNLKVDSLNMVTKAKANGQYINSMMALGEAIAHLHYLVNTGDLVAEADASGVHWFARN